MEKDEALKYLQEMGYRAKIEDGVIMLDISCKNIADFKKQFLKARLELEKAGYRGSIGAREVAEDAGKEVL